MLAEPKARSQVPNGAMGGVFCFTAMSAVSAELAVTANVAAASISFFMTIPILILAARLCGPRRIAYCRRSVRGVAVKTGNEL